MNCSHQCGLVLTIIGAHNGGMLGERRDRQMTERGNMRFWGLKNCDSCKKAQKALMAAGYEVDMTDVRADGVAAEDLARFHAAFDEALVNKRSTTWRGLSDAERAGDPLALLAEYPTLMKRPVVEDGDRLTLGWDAKAQAVWL